MYYLYWNDKQSQRCYLYSERVWTDTFPTYIHISMNSQHYRVQHMVNRKYRTHTNSAPVYYFPVRHFGGSSNRIFSRGSFIGEGLVIWMIYFFKWGNVKKGQLIRYFPTNCKKLDTRHCFCWKNYKEKLPQFQD